MGALKEWNVMQFIKGAGRESFLSQNPIKLMIFIASGSPLVYVILINSLASKFDRTRSTFEYILTRDTWEWSLHVTADGPRGTHVPRDFFLGSVPSCHGFVPFSPERRTPSLSYPWIFPERRHHLKLFPLTFPTCMTPQNLQPASVRALDWTSMDPKHSNAAFLLLISFKQENTRNNITPRQQCFPGANRAIKKP